MRVVDVVDDEIAFRASDDPDIVAYAGGAGLHVGKDSVAEDDGHGVGQIHACVGLHALAIEAHNVAIREHPDEVQGIDSQVEQGSAA